MDEGSLPIFGRPHAFTVECPACGDVLIIRGRQAASGNRADFHTGDVWEPRASLLTCPTCRRRWVIGLAVYAYEGRGRPVLPKDQTPSLVQLAKIRARVGSEWVMREDRRAQVVRSHRTEACTCVLTGQGGCPRHARGEEE